MENSVGGIHSIIWSVEVSSYQMDDGDDDGNGGDDDDDGDDDGGDDGDGGGGDDDDDDDDSSRVWMPGKRRLVLHLKKRTQDETTRRSCSFVKCNFPSNDRIAPPIRRFQSGAVFVCLRR